MPVPPEKNFSVAQFPAILIKTPAQKFLSSSRLLTLSGRALRKAKKKMGLEDPDTSDEWLLGREILKALAGFSRAHNLRLVLVLAPPVRWFLGTDEPIRRSLEAFAGREKLEFVDLTPFFMEAVQKNSIDDFYIPEDHHWTARGNALTAEVLAGYFKKNPL